MNLKRLENELLAEKNKFADENEIFSVVVDRDRDSDESTATGTSRKIIDKSSSTLLVQKY